MAIGRIGYVMVGFRRMERHYGEFLTDSMWRVAPVVPGGYGFPLCWDKETFLSQANECNGEMCCWCGDPMEWL